MMMHDLVKKAEERGAISERTGLTFLHLYDQYSISFKETPFPTRLKDHLFETLLDLVIRECANPTKFESFHKSERTPYDYYRFGIDFIQPIVDKENSKLVHPENVEKMRKQIAQKENVVLLANHQTEVDPQLTSIILEDKYSDFGEELIFVAGDRVVTDPIAMPFSKGRNLLCIYSKRHIDNPPEQKEMKALHNRRTMHRMKELLSVGGRAIYVAPSGGRDRRNAEGVVEVAPFDGDSLEMFRLMAKESGTPTHFYPLSLSTYAILPPPDIVERELGELRKTNRSPITFLFGDEIDVNHYPGSENPDRRLRRAIFAKYVWNLVNEGYNKIKVI